MTGAVSWEALIWVTGLLIAAGAGVAGFVLWVWHLVEKTKSELGAQLTDRDSAAQLEKERAKLVEDDLRKELAEYKVHAAEHFASKSGVTQAVDRVEGAVKALTGQVEAAVDRLTGRIDRLLESRASETPTRRTGS